MIAGTVSLSLCCALFAGTTYAWFTDSASSAASVIQSGNLDISAEIYDLTAAKADTELKTLTLTSAFLNGRTAGDLTVAIPEKGADLEGNENFITDSLFEPGKTYVKLIRVKNEGSLAVKVSLHFDTANGGLENALWYSAITASDAAGGTSEINAQPISQLNTGLGNEEIVIYPKDDTNTGYQDIILAYGMNTDASNEYQDKSYSAKVTVLATQYEYEKDSYDETYDATAGYPVTATDFINQLSNGGNLVLTENTTLPNIQWSVIDIPDGTVLDLQNNTVYNYNFSSIMQGSNITIQNGRFEVLANTESYSLFVGDEETTDNFVLENLNMYGGVNVYHASNVILRNCEIQGTRFYAVWADPEGEVIIESGTYRGGGPAVIGASSGNNGAGRGSITVNGGTFYAENSNCIVYADENGKDNGLVTINGGTFYTNNGTVVRPLKDGSLAKTVIIKGGTFDADPAGYVTEGYKVETSTVDGVTWYTVVPE